jgi:regulation of enolase protein 1 (concanavalin A-like superfamily)
MKIPRRFAALSVLVFALAWAIPSALFGQVYNSCDQWGNFSTGGYTIYNNIWGSGAGSQCLTVNSPANWFVDANHPNTSGIKSYPNVERQLSLNVDTMGSVTSAFAVTRPSGGAYSSTYDIWYNNYAYEVMLWMNQTGAIGPIASSWDANGNPVAQATNVSVGGHTWNIYRGSNGVNAVFSFVRTSNTNSGTVDITAISQWLRNAGWFGNVNLHSVQFGFEITASNGNQRYSVTNFSVTAGAAASLTVSTASQSYGAAAATQTASITSNVSWTASANQSWITVTPASGSNNATLNIAVTQNTGTASRSGTVTVVGGGFTRTIAITQAGAPVSPPAAPTGLAATAGNAQISLSWSASSGATSYNVKRATTSGGTYTTVASPTGTSYTNTGLTNGTTYYYVVSAVNTGGQSANSAQVSATPYANGPATTQAEAGVLSGGTIDTDNVGFNGTGFVNLNASAGSLQFNSVNGGTGGAATLAIRFALGAASSRTGNLVVNGVTQAITFPVTGAWTTWNTLSVPITLNSGSTNTLRFETTGLDLANLDEITVTPASGPVAPAAPTGLSAAAGNAQVSLSWTAASGATSYNIKRSTTSGGTYTTVVSSTATSYVNTGLTNGTTYYYVVSAVNTVGESANSSQASATPAVPILSGLLLYEGFGYTSGASIANLAGGLGWGANWSNTGNVQDISTAQASSLSSGTLLGSGGSVKFGPSSAGGSTSSGVYMRQFAGTVGSMAATSSGTVWLSMLYLNSTNSLDASGFYGEARIGLYSGVTAVSGVTQTSGATLVLNTGTPATSATVLDRISLYNGATIAATSIATPRSTTPALLLLKIVANNTTATDSVYLWVNPNLANGEPAVATANASWTTSDVSSVNGLRFQQAGANNGVVDNIDEIRLGRTFGDVTPSATLPSPWATADVGTVAAVGNAGYSSGVFTVAGSGAGIGAVGTGDELRYVQQASSGDCSILARVTAVQNTSANAKAGVMIRETVADTSIQASCTVANGSVAFIRRLATGGTSTTTTVSGLNPPYWVRLERVGNVFTASHSPDGSNWTTVGSDTITMATTATLGLAVTSQADGTLTNTTLDSVTATP